MTKISNEVLAVLSACGCDGPNLNLSGGNLHRKLYLDVAKVIEAAGGKWNRKAKAHVFPGDAAAAIDPVLLTGEVLNTKQDFGQFYTPAPVARTVIHRAAIRPGDRVLEPSAGRGALAEAAFLAGGAVDCIEIDPTNAEHLRGLDWQRHFAQRIIEGDFLSLMLPRYDVVVMNPPFARQADVAHVLRAARHLKPGGRLVSVMSAGVTFRQNRYMVGFRAFLDNEVDEALIDPLPPGSFRESGTDVNAVIVSFQVRA